MENATAGCNAGLRSQHLNPGGRLFAVEGEEPIMKALLLQRAASGDIDRQTLLETCIPPLRNALQRNQFVF